MAKDFHIVAETGITLVQQLCWFKLQINLLQISLLGKINQ